MSECGPARGERERGVVVHEWEESGKRVGEVSSLNNDVCGSIRGIEARDEWAEEGKRGRRGRLRPLQA